MSPSSVSSTTSAERERLRLRRVVRVRVGEDMHAGGVRCADAAAGVLDGRAPAGVDAEATRSLEVDVGPGLSSRHLLRRDGRGETPGDAGRREHGVDQRPVRGGCDSQWERCCEAPHCLDGAVDQWQLAPVALEHPAHHLGVDLGRRRRQAELVVHVARPLRGARSPSSPAAPLATSDRPSRRPAARAPRPTPARCRRGRRPCRRSPLPPCARSYGSAMPVRRACRACRTRTVPVAPRAAAGRAPCCRRRASGPATSRRA